MPQSRHELRDKFFKVDAEGNMISDGIEEAETIITKYLGTVTENGFVTMEDVIFDNLSDDQQTEFWEAVEFLMDEWDYGFEMI